MSTKSDSENREKELESLIASLVSERESHTSDVYDELNARKAKAFSVLETQGVLNALKTIILETQADPLSEKPKLRNLKSPGTLIWDGESLTDEKDFGFRHCFKIEEHELKILSENMTLHDFTDESYYQSIKAVLGIDGETVLVFGSILTSRDDGAYEITQSSSGIQQISLRQLWMDLVKKLAQQIEESAQAFEEEEERRYEAEIREEIERIDLGEFDNTIC